jgi:hypothetical protein
VIEATDFLPEMGESNTSYSPGLIATLFFGFLFYGGTDTPAGYTSRGW